MRDSSRDMLTIREVAAQYDRSIEQVRRYVRDRKLPARKIGMQWFVAPDDAAAFRLGKSGKDSKMEEWLNEVKQIREAIRQTSGYWTADEVAEAIHQMREERIDEILAATGLAESTDTPRVFRGANDPTGEEQSSTRTDSSDRGHP